MALEEEILQAGNILEGASAVVDKGLSIFENVAHTFFPMGYPQPTGPVQDKTPTVTQASKAAPVGSPTSSKIGLLIAGAVLLYLFTR